MQLAPVVCAVDSAARTRTPIHKVVVVNVSDVDVRNPRVGDVHAIEVAVSRVIPRNEGLTETEWAPAKTATETEAKVDSPPWATKPRDQCRRIVRTHPKRTWSPTPIAACPNPTSIVKWRITPRLILDPSPTPRILPNPVAVVIRGPTRIDGRGPYLTVIWRVLPGSVFIEVFGSHCIGRNVTSRFGMIEFLITRVCPLIESIGRRSGVNIVVQRSTVVKPRLLIGFEMYRRSAAG